MQKIFLYEELGSETNFEPFKTLNPDEETTLYINSPGGDLLTGLTLFNILSKCKKLNVMIDGLAASAASLFAFIPNANVTMRENSFLFIHLPFACLMGPKKVNELRSLADQLEKLGCSILDIYAKKAKCSRDELQNMMEQETLLTAKESLDLGFCDNIDFEEVGEMDYPAKFVAKIQERNNKQKENVKKKTAVKTYEDGIIAERARLKTIEALGNFPEFNDLIQKAKYETGADAGQVAILILQEIAKNKKEEKTKVIAPINLVDFYKNLKSDASACEFEGEPTAIEDTSISLNSLFKSASSKF